MISLEGILFYQTSTGFMPYGAKDTASLAQRILGEKE